MAADGIAEGDASIAVVKLVAAVSGTAGSEVDGVSSKVGGVVAVN